MEADNKIKDAYKEEFGHSVDDFKINWTDEEDIKRHLRFWTRVDIRDKTNFDILTHCSIMLHTILDSARTHGFDLEKYYLSLIIERDLKNQVLSVKDLQLVQKHGYVADNIKEFDGSEFRGLDQKIRIYSIQFSLNQL